MGGTEAFRSAPGELYLYFVPLGLSEAPSVAVAWDFPARTGQESSRAPAALGEAPWAARNGRRSALTVV